MRLVLIFFLYWCFHLLGGYDAAHAGTPAGNVGSSRTQRIEKAGQAEKVTADQLCIISKSGSFSEESVHLITVEEEDDEEESFGRKQVVSVTCFLAFSYAFLLNHHNNCSAGLLSSCKHPSFIAAPKYIAQRVLRI